MLSVHFVFIFVPFLPQYFSFDQEVKQISESEFAFQASDELNILFIHFCTSPPPLPPSPIFSLLWFSNFLYTFSAFIKFPCCWFADLGQLNSWGLIIQIGIKRFFCFSLPPPSLPRSLPPSLPPYLPLPLKKILSLYLSLSLSLSRICSFQMIHFHYFRFAARAADPSPILLQYSRAHADGPVTRAQHHFTR